MKIEEYRERVLVKNHQGHDENIPDHCKSWLEYYKKETSKNYEIQARIINESQQQIAKLQTILNEFQIFSYTSLFFARELKAEKIPDFKTLKDSLATFDEKLSQLNDDILRVKENPASFLSIMSELEKQSLYNEIIKFHLIFINSFKVVQIFDIQKINGIYLSFFLPATLKKQHKLTPSQNFTDNFLILPLIIGKIMLFSLQFLRLISLLLIISTLLNLFFKKIMIFLVVT